MDEERVKNLIKNLIIEIGEDPTREGLRDTPKRIAKMYKEIFGGYESDSQIGVQFSEDSDTVIVKNIEFYSMCEHHMLPFFGKIHIAYLPNGRVFGVSKLIRLVEKYSKRLQIQERLTKNEAATLYKMISDICQAITIEATKTRANSMAYQVQFGQDSFGTLMLSCAVIERFPRCI